MTSHHDPALRLLRAADPRLAALIDRVGACHLDPRRTDDEHRAGHFTGLARAIVAQQLSNKAAATIFARVHALGRGDDGHLSAAKILATPAEKLREAGLSGQKARYVVDLCEHVERGSIALGKLDDLDDEAVIETLCQVKGVGRWTAEMFLMFRLGREDVLPVDDLGIKKGFQALFNLRKLPDAARMTKLAKPFRPYRSIACWYLWRINDVQPREGEG